MLISHTSTHLKFILTNCAVFLPPVTSHIGVMGESSGGTPPTGSGSTEAFPGMRSTRANRRWSQRKGSLVSSLPGNGVVRGKWSWKQKNKFIKKKTCDALKVDIN